MFSRAEILESSSGKEDDGWEDELYYVPIRHKRTGEEYLVCPDALKHEDILDAQIELKKDHPLYIPTPEEVLDVWKNEYPMNTNKYIQNTIDRLQSRFQVGADDAEEIVYDLWVTFANNGNPLEKLQGLADEYKLEVKHVKDVIALSDIVMELYNHTNRMDNNGYPPYELSERFKLEGKEDELIFTSVDGMAAILLKDADVKSKKIKSADAKNVGIKDADIESADIKNAEIKNADGDTTSANVMTFRMEKGRITGQVKKKIYPNDPCPCGSGKKYKNCCGGSGAEDGVK